ncbi:MAG: hypothetical protein ATN31_08425 [Candidatus Epulonipiscioides saccharophilum]|nr:MAG: hypothetical protein ATN31_08425 [Epulopiscium sp. AS2M-Bin001]
MELKRIFNKNDLHYKNAYSLYLEAFPLEQTRNSTSQEFVLKDPNYHFNIILVDNSFAGFLMCWHYDEYIYIEHFAIAKHLRGSGLGTQALSLLKNYDKLLILEIDPPIDDYSISRQKFYERSGFILNMQFEHNPPAYRLEYKQQQLVIMASGPLTDILYQTYYQHVCSNILRPLLSTQQKL